MTGLRCRLGPGEQVTEGWTSEEACEEKVGSMMRFVVVAALAIGLTASVYAAGGEPKREPVADRLAEADRHYNKGLQHRDKAWEYEKKADGAEGSRKQQYTEAAQREFRLAIGEFQEATQQNSRHVEAFGSLGYAQRKVGQFEDALKSYNRALRMNPDYAQALEYRAEAYMELGKLSDASADYRRLVDLDKDLARQFLGAAMVWFKDGRQTVDGLETFRALVESEAEKLGPTKGDRW